MYADDLVHMAQTTEQLRRRVAEWRVIILDKGMKLNSRKSKVMVGSSGWKMIVNSGKWSCAVCGELVQSNAVNCTVCQKWIHRWYSGVCGNM